MFCFHKWDKPDPETRYQTCTKCGKAIVAPCPHKWKKSGVFDVTRLGLRKGQAWVFTCEKCGEVKQQRVGLGDYDND